MNFMAAIVVEAHPYSERQHEHGLGVFSMFVFVRIAFLIIQLEHQHRVLSHVGISRFNTGFKSLFVARLILDTRTRTVAAGV